VSRSPCVERLSARKADPQSLATARSPGDPTHIARLLVHRAEGEIVSVVVDLVIIRRVRAQQQLGMASPSRAALQDIQASQVGA